MAWVGYQTVTSADDLRALLEACQTDNCRYFLRWPSHVSGFITALPKDGPSPEGQLFGSDRELRWRRQGSGYSVLVLTTEDVDKTLKLGPVTFEAIAGSWTSKDDYNAQVYPPTETRLPTMVQDNGVNIRQRYFRDETTAIVHFIALVLSEPSISEKKS